MSRYIQELMTHNQLHPPLAEFFAVMHGYPSYTQQPNFDLALAHLFSPAIHLLKERSNRIGYTYNHNRHLMYSSDKNPTPLLGNPTSVLRALSLTDISQDPVSSADCLSLLLFIGNNRIGSGSAYHYRPVSYYHQNL